MIVQHKLVGANAKMGVQRGSIRSAHGSIDLISYLLPERATSSRKPLPSPLGRRRVHRPTSHELSAPRYTLKLNTLICTVPVGFPLSV
jgi:hypothetical protein